MMVMMVHCTVVSVPSETDSDRVRFRARCLSFLISVNPHVHQLLRLWMRGCIHGFALETVIQRLRVGNRLLAAGTSVERHLEKVVKRSSYRNNDSEKCNLMMAAMDRMEGRGNERREKSVTCDSTQETGRVLYTTISSPMP